MTFITETPPSNSVFHRAYKAAGTLLGSIGKAFAIHADCDSRMQEVARLRGLSDAELKEMGLTQDRIVHHVFRDVFYL